MRAGGLSEPRLERTHRVLSGYIERKEMPGLVALVSRHNDVHVETPGTMSVGHPAPMRRDTISRVASLTKPITAAFAGPWHAGVRSILRYVHPPAHFRSPGAMELAFRLFIRAAQKRGGTCGSVTLPSI
jgi:hypothetical protein